MCIQAVVFSLYYSAFLMTYMFICMCQADVTHSVKSKSDDAMILQLQTELQKLTDNSNVCFVYFIQAIVFIV